VSDILRTISLRVPEIFLELCPEVSARRLISPATTEKPRPASPACAASMAAFMARRFVSAATLSMTEIISVIVRIDCSSSRIEPTVCLSAAVSFMVSDMTVSTDFLLSLETADVFLMFWIICSMAAKDSSREAT
jgi:hypothetical protein